DCDGSVDEGDPQGGTSCSTGQLGICAAGTRHCSEGALICVRNQNPTSETCNGLDDDCDGTTDEGDPGSGGSCSTGQSGICPPGTLHCSSGSLQCQRNQNPTTEVCNGVDDDCDGSTDEGNPGGGGACNTGQAGICAPGTQQCSGGSLQCVRNQNPTS